MPITPLIVGALLQGPVPQLLPESLELPPSLPVGGHALTPTSGHLGVSALWAEIQPSVRISENYLGVLGWAVRGRGFLSSPTGLARECSSKPSALAVALDSDIINAALEQTAGCR